MAAAAPLGGGTGLSLTLAGFFLRNRAELPSTGAAESEGGVITAGGGAGAGGEAPGGKEVREEV